MRHDLDRDAFFTLALSNLAILISAGLSLLYVLYRVARTANRATTTGVADAQVLVFGHRLNADGEPSRDYTLRLQRAAWYLQHQADSTLLLLGGVTRPGLPSEAAVGRQHIHRLGGAAERVHIEGDSQHTLDNLRQALRLLAPPPKKVVLLSNRYHLERALVFARTMGVAAQPCAAEDTLRLSPRTAWTLLHEAYLLHWYLTGKRWALLTGNQRMLKRLHR